MYFKSRYKLCTDVLTWMYIEQCNKYTWEMFSYTCTRRYRRTKNKVNLKSLVSRILIKPFWGQFWIVVNRGVGSEVETGLITNLNNKQKMYNFTKKVWGGEAKATPPPLFPVPVPTPLMKYHLIDLYTWYIHVRCKYSATGESLNWF